jgi:hypothetical protein
MAEPSVPVARIASDPGDERSGSTSSARSSSSGRRCVYLSSVSVIVE